MAGRNGKFDLRIVFSNFNPGFDYICGIYSFYLVQHCQSTCKELGVTVVIYLQTSSCLIIPDRGILSSVFGKLGLVHISTNTTCTGASHHGPQKIRGFCEKKAKAKGKITPWNGCWQGGSSPIQQKTDSKLSPLIFHQ